MPDSLGLDRLQEAVDLWIQQHGVRYFNELTNLAVLSEEVGEVARIIARDYGEQSWKQGAAKSELADELADVIFVVCCLANQTGVDLNSTLAQRLKFRAQRDAARHKENAKLS